jgi:hypothetical protein
MHMVLHVITHNHTSRSLLGLVDSFFIRALSHYFFTRHARMQRQAASLVGFCLQLYPIHANSWETLTEGLLLFTSWNDSSHGPHSVTGYLAPIFPRESIMVHVTTDLPSVDARLHSMRQSWSSARDIIIIAEKNKFRKKKDCHSWVWSSKHRV